MHIIVMPPHIIMQGMPLIIMRDIASQRSLNMSPDIPSMGMHFIVMPSLVMSMVIRHIMGIIPMPIIGIMPIMGIIGIMLICGIMPGIVPMPIMLGIIIELIGIAFIGWLIGIDGIIMAPGPPVSWFRRVVCPPATDSQATLRRRVRFRPTMRMTVCDSG
jgi:hypothetical protein